MQSLSNASNARKSLPFWCTLFCLLTFVGATTQAQEKVVLNRADATVMLEPYAPNIVRVTLSLNKADATSAPGYGITASPSAAGWSETSGKSGDVFKSDRMVVTVGASGHWTPTGT